MNALVYTRVSTREQADEGYSLEAQREACRRFATEKGLHVVGEYEDRGESATSLRRTQFQEMLGRIESDTSITHVVVHKLDRFGRNLDDYVAVRAELKKRNVKIISVSEPLEDPKIGVLVENLMASLSDWYSRNLSAETKKGKDEKAQEGWYPSVAPIGYTNVRGDDGKAIIVVDPETAPLVQQAYELYATGEHTLKSLQKQLTVLGLKGKGGKPLALSRLASMLQNPFYTGRFVWNGMEMNGKHEPIVPVDLAFMAKQVLEANNQGRLHKRVHDHYLKGLLRCSCGRRMGITVAKGRYVYFLCLGRGKCAQPLVPSDEIEKEIEALYAQIRIPDEHLRQIAGEMEQELGRREAHRSRMARNLTQRLQKLAKERDKLMAAYYADAIPVEVLKREQERITAEEALLTLQLQTLSERIEKSRELVRIGLKLIADCQASYREASPDVRRKWNEAFFEKIVVKERKVSRVTYREPFRSLLSPSLIQRDWRRRTGIEPACELVARTPVLKTPSTRDPRCPAVPR